MELTVVLRRQPFFQFHHHLVQNNFKKKCNNINEATTKHILNMSFQTLKYLSIVEVNFTSKVFMFAILARFNYQIIE